MIFEVLSSFLIKPYFLGNLDFHYVGNASVKGIYIRYNKCIIIHIIQRIYTSIFFQIS